METRDAFVQKMEAQLKEWAAEIDRLAARAEKAAADARIEYEREIKALRERRREATEKLQELQRSTGDAWEDLMAGVERAWSALGEAVTSATARFK